MSRWAPVRGVRAAFIFFTRIPVGGFPYTRGEWRWASAHAPLVGAVLGALLGLVDRALSPLGDAAAAVGTLAVSLMLTGAFHEDGLADTSDALGGAYDRAKVFVILKDSRVGTFGACAVVVSIVGRATLLAQLGYDAAWALPFVGSLARAVAVGQMVALPYVTADGARSRDLTRAGAAQGVVASVWVGLVAAALVLSGHIAAARAGGALVAAAGMGVLSGWRYVRRVGGLTGDFLGATEQLCELVALAVLAWNRA